jgi:uncharacterized protein YjbI with pentapeptide repeats
MADESQVAMLKRSVEEWNEWRGMNMRPRLQGDLRDADISRANLDGCDLIDVTLSGANLERCIMDNVLLWRTNLEGAVLRGTTITNTRFVNTSLVSADFAKAELALCQIDVCDVRQTNFREAQIESTVFQDLRFDDVQFNLDRCGYNTFVRCDFRKARGLEDCFHFGPSALDHLTLEMCSGVPASFLRGCGLPAKLISYLPSIFGTALEFYSVFISYSTSDQQFADRLHADLQNHGVRCWFAPHDITGGKKIYEQIDEAIRVYDRLLLILSDSSMTSQWVKTEIANALDKEQRNGRRVLFPLSLVPFDRVREWKNFIADIGIDAAREIREYYIPDFTGWDTDHTRYNEAFDKLLKGLKADDATAGDG